MAQIFHRSTNFIARFSLFSGIFLAGLALTAVVRLAHSPYFSRQNGVRTQPVPFSPKHHSRRGRIHLSFFPPSVEPSATAGIPPTKTCMSCHSVLFNDVGYLEPIRESYRTDTSIQWVRVHRLADYVYFNHSIHVSKGVGCSTCHGRVDQMPLMFQANSLLMEWGLNCHRNTEMALRPLDKVYDMTWQPAANQSEIGKQLQKERHIQSTITLTTCSTCHR